MMTLARRKRRPDMRRAVILFPSGLTLGNLFFGVFAIIAASRLEFVAAGVYVMLGGICDALDGRVARATNAGTEFGEELDSLVDAITFGLAPGMIMYFAVLNRSGWDWIWVFLFTACAVLRLARFNIEQAGSAKTYFQGLPSPAAGITLASYYWFSQSSLYTYGAIADLKWHVLLRYLMVVLSFLMISNVPYPVFPRTGFRSLRAIGATLLIIGSVVLLATRRLEFFFPFALVYVAWGLLRWVFSGLFERRQPTLPYDLSEGEDDDDDDDEEFELTDSRVHATKRSHRLERAARMERVERPDRSDREDQPEPSRSRSERATPSRTAVAEKAPERGARSRDTERPRREGRPKERTQERPRRDRPPREPKPDVAETPLTPASQVTNTGVDAITLGEPDRAASSPAAALPPNTVPLGGESAEPGAPRKRKRRRRRGERKDRLSNADAAGASSDSDGEPYADSSDDAYADSGDAEHTPSTPTAAPESTSSPNDSPPPLPRSSSEPSE